MSQASSERNSSSQQASRAIHYNKEDFQAVSEWDSQFQWKYRSIFNMFFNYFGHDYSPIVLKIFKHCRQNRGVFVIPFHFNSRIYEDLHGDQNESIVIDLRKLHQYLANQYEMFYDIEYELGCWEANFVIRPIPKRLISQQQQIFNTFSKLCTQPRTASHLSGFQRRNRRDPFGCNNLINQVDIDAERQLLETRIELIMNQTSSDGYITTLNHSSIYEDYDPPSHDDDLDEEEKEETLRPFSSENEACQPSKTFFLVNNKDNINTEVFVSLRNQRYHLVYFSLLIDLNLMNSEDYCINTDTHPFNLIICVERIPFNSPDLQNNLSSLCENVPTLLVLPTLQDLKSMRSYRHGTESDQSTLSIDYVNMNDTQSNDDNSGELESNDDLSRSSNWAPRSRKRGGSRANCKTTLTTNDVVFKFSEQPNSSEKQKSLLHKKFFSTLSLSDLCIFIAVFVAILAFFIAIEVIVSIAFY